MIKFCAALCVGLILGLGLCISSMTDSAKVLNFLDIFGNWDPSLALVLGSAVIVAFVGYRFTAHMRKPILDDKFQFPNRTDIDFPLVTGASVFGLGWGMAGFCPGPGLALILIKGAAAIWFVPALLVGLWIGRPSRVKTLAKDG